MDDAERLNRQAISKRRLDLARKRTAEVCEGSIVQLDPHHARYAGFKIGRVTQAHDDGSVFVDGKPDSGPYFVGARCFTVLAQPE